ncbi:MAG: type III pantothenate kinase [Cellvibrionaceae bacterium]
MTVQDKSILDVDVGNTRIKWRLLEGESVALEGVSNHSDNLSDRFRKDLAEKKIDRVRVATVVRGDVLADLSEACRALWSVELEVAEVRQQCSGVEQGYEDCSRLGVDRWLGVLAAYNKYQKACLVVSCGTAATLDFVDADGLHLGGYIVPGLNLMRQSLFGGTDAVKVDKFVVGDSLEFGRNTDAAVNNGLVLMLSSMIKQVFERLSLNDENFQLVICGGDGEIISRHLELQNIYVKSLVLDGLAYALP